MAKLWYKSKTIWVNLIAVSALIIQSQTGFLISLETQVALIVIINLVLRVITGEELELMKED